MQDADYTAGQRTTVEPRRFYRCWAGTEHNAVNIPADATDDTLLQFQCGCMGTFEQAPPVIAAVKAAGGPISFHETRRLAEGWTPPRNPVIRVGDLENGRRWTREEVERVWDVFSTRGLELDRQSMYHDEGADSEFCETHRQTLAETLNRAGLVPGDG